LLAGGTGGTRRSEVAARVARDGGLLG